MALSPDPPAAREEREERQKDEKQRGERERERESEQRDERERGSESVRVKDMGGVRPEKSGVRICTRSKETLLSQE